MLDSPEALRPALPAALRNLLDGYPVEALLAPGDDCPDLSGRLSSHLLATWRADLCRQIATMGPADGDLQRRMRDELLLAHEALGLVGEQLDARRGPGGPAAAAGP